MVITRVDCSVARTGVQCRVDTADEVEYYRNGGILHYVLR
jgi:aconitate hydratase